MLKAFYPKEYLESVYLVPFEQFYKKGIRGALFDVDNTLVPHGEPADARVIELFSQLHEMGMETCLLSNNKEPRVSSFASEIGSEYIFKSGKPRTKNYKRAMERMGTTPSSTIFVGDQLFTDIYGANRSGIYSILVKPIHPKEEFQIVLKRKPEAVVLYFYKRRLAKDGKR